MSASPIAALRKPFGSVELAKLTEDHLQHDLRQSDRDALKSATASVSTGVMVGSLIGVTAGIVLGLRVRSTRTAMFNAFRAKEKPVKVVFEDGREGESILSDNLLSQYFDLHDCIYLLLEKLNPPASQLLHACGSLLT